MARWDLTITATKMSDPSPDVMYGYLILRDDLVVRRLAGVSRSIDEAAEDGLEDMQALAEEESVHEDAFIAAQEFSARKNIQEILAQQDTGASMRDSVPNLPAPYSIDNPTPPGGMSSVIAAAQAMSYETTKAIVYQQQRLSRERLPILPYSEVVRRIDSQTARWLRAKPPRTPRYAHLSDRAYVVLVQAIMDSAALAPSEETRENYLEYWKTHPLGHFIALGSIDLLVIRLPDKLQGVDVWVSPNSSDEITAAFELANSPAPELEG